MQQAVLGSCDLRAKVQGIQNFSGYFHIKTTQIYAKTSLAQVAESYR
jgi:site-specific recombinase XerC